MAIDNLSLNTLASHRHGAHASSSLSLSEVLSTGRSAIVRTLETYVRRDKYVHDVRGFVTFPETEPGDWLLGHLRASVSVLGLDGGGDGDDDDDEGLGPSGGGPGGDSMRVLVVCHGGLYDHEPEGGSHGLRPEWMVPTMEWDRSFVLMRNTGYAESESDGGDGAKCVFSFFFCFSFSLSRLPVYFNYFNHARTAI